MFVTPLWFRFVLHGCVFVLRLMICRLVFLRICFLFVSECVCRDFPVVVLYPFLLRRNGSFWRFMVCFVFVVCWLCYFVCLWGVWMADGVGWSLLLLFLLFCCIFPVFSFCRGFQCFWQYNMGFVVVVWFVLFLFVRVLLVSRGPPSNNSTVFFLLCLG